MHDSDAKEVQLNYVLRDSCYLNFCEVPTDDFIIPNRVSKSVLQDGVYMHLPHNGL